MTEPRRVALGLLVTAGPRGSPRSRPHPAGLQQGDRDLLCRAMASGCNSPASSSVGRLFDGVASLLGLCQRLSYEGQGGLRLQGAAVRETDSAAAPSDLIRLSLPLVAGAALEDGLAGPVRQGGRPRASAGSTGRRCWRSC